MKFKNLFLIMTTLICSRVHAGDGPCIQNTISAPFCVGNYICAPFRGRNRCGYLTALGREKAFLYTDLESDPQELPVTIAQIQKKEFPPVENHSFFVTLVDDSHALSVNGGPERVGIRVFISPSIPTYDPSGNTVLYAYMDKQRKHELDVFEKTLALATVTNERIIINKISAAPYSNWNTKVIKSATIGGKTFQFEDWTDSK